MSGNEYKRYPSQLYARILPLEHVGILKCTENFFVYAVLRKCYMLNFVSKEVIKVSDVYANSSMRNTSTLIVFHKRPEAEIGNFLGRALKKAACKWPFSQSYLQRQ